MPLNKPFFHVVDTETTGLSAGHKKTGLLQLYSTNFASQHNARPFDPRTLVKPSKGYVDPRSGNFIQFDNNFAGGADVLHAAQHTGTLSEEEMASGFFSAASEELATRRRVLIGAWNPGYDTGVLEAVAQRYSSLEQYRGFFQKPGVKTFGLESSFLEFAHQYGQANPEFAQKYFRMGQGTPITKELGPGLQARTPEQMRYVSGWSVENITKAAGGREKIVGTIGQFHEAVTDVNIEQSLFEKFRLAKKVVNRGYGFDLAMKTAGVLPAGETADTFFKQVFSNKWTETLAEQAKSGVKATPLARNAFAGQATKVLLLAAAATVAYSLASSKREDRQTQITGLSDGGHAAKSRHKWSDFGSGWQGDDNSSTTARDLFLGAAAFGAHKYALKNYASYAEGVYATLRKIETRSPSELFKTFGTSQLASSYLVNEVHLKPEQLFFGRDLTETGQQIKRLTGVDALTNAQFKTGMSFKRMNASSPYLELVGGTGQSVRFAERGRLTGSSARYGMRLREPIAQRLMTEGGPIEQIKELFKMRTERQYPRAPLAKKEGFQAAFGGENMVFQPLYGRKAGILGRAESLFDTGSRVAFEAAERPLRMLGGIGLGVNFGSYNKLAHVPFMGEGGLLNKLLFSRVLPAYAAVTAARYINHKLDNKPAETIAGVPLKARVAWGDLTDKIPGLRSLTDKYEEVVPGPQYGPIALPLGAGALTVALGHYLPLARGTVEYATRGARVTAARAAFKSGAKWGALAALPFLPGMIGSRKTGDELRRIYSGEDEVPVRSGRWWDVGSTPFSGGRIKYFRPHWYAQMQSKAETVATYGSEDAYWEHHPILHPFKYLKDPYWLEKQNYEDRPYPVTSPAFSNVPLVGPFLAATVGRLVKPVQRMHEKDWDINNYTLYSPRIEPNMALGGLAPSKPREEFSFRDVVKQEVGNFAEYTGLPGFIANTLYGAAGPKGTPGEDVTLQGSRQMTSWSRSYYQRELGALSGINPGDMGGMPFGYSEPLRRFIQPDRSGVQANEIPNTMPSWLPGEDYMVNFRTGDPFTKIPEGASRLPGKGYGALHPELEGVAPADYDAFTRYKILADVAPYSKEYMIYRSKIEREAKSDTSRAIDFARIEDQVRQVKESTVQFEQRRFTAPVERLTGTIKRATPSGIELEEYPGRTFNLSSIGTTAADLSAVALGQQNDLTRNQVSAEVDRRNSGLQTYLAGQVGQRAELVVPAGTEQHAAEARAVIFVDDVNLNQELIERGYARRNKDNSGAEAQAMYTSMQNALGKYAETLAFTGEGGVNRLLPTPFHTKYWNERTALSLYEEQEVYGSRMRRWQRPFHDMVAPWARGMYKRLTGDNLVPQEVEHRRDIDSMVDQLDYLRGYIQAAANPTNAGRYTSQSKRTNIGGNLFGATGFVATTLPRREKLYFSAFLQETDPEKRQQILESVSPELARALTAQWVKTDAMLARAAGKEVPDVQEGGVLYTEQGLKDYEQAETDLSYSDFIRSQQISKTFSKLGFNLPGPGSPLWSEGIDYEDVKLKVVQNEGYDYHDFNIYDDRADVLWRKPYIDGAARELVGGSAASGERVRQTVERIILEGQDKNPSVMSSTQSSRVGSANIRIDVDEDGTEAIMKDIRRNEDEYRDDTTT